MKSFLLFALLVALTGCTTVEQRIPSGTYLEKGTSNFIHISGDHLQLHIKGIDARDSRGAGLVFPYALWSDGRVVIIVSRSAELMYGYPALDYHWNGERISAKDPKSGSQWEFVK
ncbi:MAG: hypothetical protein HY298_14570 [Verrucomicrobia bacterium]|nr:hypothetical protein [Verrucomicrobiota bacterium]